MLTLTRCGPIPSVSGTEYTVGIVRVTRTLPAGKNSGDTWYISTAFSCSFDGLGAFLGTFSNALSIGAKILLADKYSCFSEISG